ncbi:hypothetical protein BDF20DRAFT_295336 [Mycotypha africana]|uniref:uncharacterized protein n=1 Tax=Mycotypha africana TaxID=64632 RepID=UPI0023008CD0|nr:uncharacterized protein BDF20DRAFT_295336 [Mycotypha africana]KAI8987907.1 hypothetical protein BDF20DRAFT_295336 [Mycotypha africana]
MIMQDYYHVSARLMKIEDEKKKLEKDLNYYKRINQNIELLREEKQSLAHRVKEMDTIRERNFVLETENMKLKAEHDAWACYLANSNNTTYNARTPESIIYQLTKEIEEYKYYQLVAEQYKEELKDQLNAVHTMEQHLDEMKQKMLEYQQLRAKDEAAQHLWKQNEDTLKTHIQILESQLKMYDSATSLEATTDQQQDSSTTFDDLKTKRIQELEALLKQLEDKLTTQTQQFSEQILQVASNDTTTAMPGPYESLASGARLTEVLTQLQKKEEARLIELKETQTQQKLLEKKYKATKEQLDELHRTIEKRKQLEAFTAAPAVATAAAAAAAATGKEESAEQQVTFEDKEIDPDTQGFKTVKIMYCKDSPSAQLKAIRHSTLERLRKENKDLLVQILQQQEQQQQGHEQECETISIPQSTLANLQKDIDELQQMIQKKDKRLARVQSVWASRLEDVRQLVSKLLGYDIVILGEAYNLVKLIPISPCIHSASELHFAIKRERKDNASIATAGHPQQRKHVEGTIEDEHYRYILRIVGTEKEKWMNHNLRNLFTRFIAEQRNIPVFLSHVTNELAVEARLLEDTEGDYDPELEDEDMDHGTSFLEQAQDGYQYDQDMLENEVTEMYQDQQDQALEEEEENRMDKEESNNEAYTEGYENNNGLYLNAEQQQQLNQLQQQLQQFNQQGLQSHGPEQSQLSGFGQTENTEVVEEEDYDYDENNEYDRVQEDAYDENEYINQETEYMEDNEDHTMEESYDEEESYASYDEEGDNDRHYEQSQNRVQGGHSHDEPLLIDDSSDDGMNEQEEAQEAQEEEEEAKEDQEESFLIVNESDDNNEENEDQVHSAEEEEESETEYGQLTEEGYLRQDEPVIAGDPSDVSSDHDGNEDEEEEGEGQQHEHNEKTSITESDLVTENDDEGEDELEEDMAEESAIDENEHEQAPSQETHTDVTEIASHEDVEEEAIETPMEEDDGQPEQIQESPSDTNEVMEEKEENSDISRIVDVVSHGIAAYHKQNEEKAAAAAAASDTIKDESADLDAIDDPASDESTVKQAIFGNDNDTVMMDESDVPHDNTSPVIIDKEEVSASTTITTTITVTEESTVESSSKDHSNDVVVDDDDDDDDDDDNASVKPDETVNNPVVVIHKEARAVESLAEDPNEAQSEAME